MDNKGAVEAQMLEELHDLVRQLRNEGISVTFFTRHGSSDGEVDVVVTDLTGSKDDVTLHGYGRAIDYLQIQLNAQGGSQQ